MAKLATLAHTKLYLSQHECDNHWYRIKAPAIPMYAKNAYQIPLLNPTKLTRIADVLLYSLIAKKSSKFPVLISLPYVLKSKWPFLNHNGQNCITVLASFSQDFQGELETGTKGLLRVKRVVVRGRFQGKGLPLNLSSSNLQESA